ncbi:methyltransferase domain-containing protein [Actinomadura welshii]|uniref:methyltransferase domain-containing protein n=1 Tax=Actinomadura welshii TaxID=3103817 RepID=UPI0003AD5E97|nr:methyltransferase domain-containing protein [Actinomadura madurae]
MTDWHEIIGSVPRRSFSPDVVWADLEPGPWVRIDRTTEPAKWDEVVALDQPLVTQFEDGRTEGEGLASSSLSMPTMVVEFLDQLDPFDDHRVLDIGTGAGWTAALLSTRVGTHNVTTVEVDAGLSAKAAERLKAAGYEPRIIVGDGADGWPEGAPYDRIHATCAVPCVPHIWVKQTRPGGVIVTPFSAGYGCGAVLRLDVLGDGTAVGRFSGSADYMMMRAQRPAYGAARSWTQAVQRDVRVSRTQLDPRSLPYGPVSIDLTIAALVPGVISKFYTDANGATLWILDRETYEGAWASVDYEPGLPDYEVQQAGDRSLWDETEAAYLQWLKWGRPDITRFGITVTPDKQTIWLDTPANPL